MIQNLNPLRISRPSRGGMSMMELLAAMMLMALIAVPLFGMIQASLRVSETSSQRQSGSFLRQAALEGISRGLQGSTDVLEVQEQSLVFLQADGQKARLSFDGGQLILENDQGSESLMQGIAKLRFYVVNKPSTAADGWLIGVEVTTAASRPTYPAEVSSTQVWVRPEI